MSMAAQSYSHHNLQSHHATGQNHFTQFQQHSTILHHPQPLSFGPLLHPTPILPSPGMNQHHAMQAASNMVSKFPDNSKLGPNFDFPSLNSNFYKPLNHQLQQFSPTNSKSTISIDSSSASSVSERMMSPHSTVDSHSIHNATPPLPVAPSTPLLNPVSASIAQTVPTSLSVSSASSGSSLAAVTNGNASSHLNQQTTRVSAQNGLLDILMSPDKYQELIQYHQAQNSIIFPSLHQAAYPIDALNPRLPTWEFLQVGHQRCTTKKGADINTIDEMRREVLGGIFTYQLISQ